MSDKLVVEIDSKDAEVAMRNLDRLTTAAEQMGKAFENTKGATSALRELRLMLTGIKGQSSSLDELKNSIQSLNSTADSLKRSFAGSVGQLGRIFKNEMAELKSIVQETGLGVGRAAVKGIEDGMAEAPAAIRKQGRTIAAAAKAEATRIYEAMVAGQANAKVKDPSALFQLQQAGATLSPYHKQVLASWKDSQKQMLAALKKQLAEGEVETQKILAEQASRASQLSAGSAGVASSAAAKQRAEGYTNAFGIYISKGVQEAEDAAFRRLGAGSGGVAAAAAARKRAEGYTDAFGNFIASGTQKAESAALQALSAGSGGVAAAAAGRARAEGYTNAFGMYVSKGMQLAEESAQRALSAGAGGVAAAATARSRAEGYTNAFGVYISKGVQDAEASAFAKLSAGAGGTAAAAAGRARAEGYTNAFGMYVSKGMQEEILKAETAAAKALSAGAGGIAAAAQPRARAVGSTNALGMLEPTVPDNLPKKTSEVDGLSKAFRKLTIDGNDVHSMARGLASGFNLLWLTWGNMAPLLAGAAISNAFMQTVKIGLQVQDTFTTIAALGKENGETFEAMGARVAKLNDKLIELGNSSIYGPRELAEAMQTLTLAGLKADEVIAGLGPTLQLAMAGTTSVQTAADVLVSITTAFGMGAAGFQRAADVIVRAAADSKASVESIGNAMKLASVAGEQYGASLDDVGALIAALANVGIQGSAAGTAIRNMFADMSERTPKVAAAMKKVGLEFRDADGAMKPLIENTKALFDVLQKLDGKSGKNLLADIFSERGGKAAIAALVDYKTQIKDIQGNLIPWSEENNKLAQSLRNIANSAGDAFIASAIKAESGLNSFKQAGAILQTTMYTAFQAVEPQLYMLSVALREAFASPEVLNAITALAKGVMNLAEFVAEHVKTISILIGIWGSVKLAGIGLALAMDGMKKAALAVLTVFPSMIGGTSTLAKTVNDLAVARDKEAVAALAAADAEKRAGAAAAGSAAGNAARLGTFARLLGILPGIGTAISLLATAWSIWDIVFKGANATAKDYTDVHSGKILKAIEDETSKLARIIELRGQGLTVMEAELRLKDELAMRDAEAEHTPKINSAKNALDQANAKIAAAQARVNAIESSPKDSPARVHLATARMQLESLKNTGTAAAGELRSAYTGLAEGQKQLTAAQAKYKAFAQATQNARDYDMQQEAERRRKIMDELFGKGGMTYDRGGNEAFGGPREFYEAQKTAFDQSIQEIEKRGKVEVEKLQSIAADKKAILDSEQQAGLISTEEYNSQLMVLLKSSEDAQITEIRKTSQKFRAEYDNRHRTISDLIAKAEAAPAKGKGANAAKASNLAQLRAELGTLEELGVTSSERWASAIDKLTSRYDKDLQVAINKNLGSLKKLGEEDDKFWKDGADELAKAKALDAVNQQYANINESVFSLDEANKAYALAFADSFAKVEAYVVKLNTELETAQYAAEEFWYAAVADGEFSDTDSSGYISYLKKIQGLEKLIIEAREKGVTLAGDTGKLAFDRKRREQNTKLASDLSDAVMTGLFDGAEAGKKKLRDVLVAELKRPITMVINLAMNAAVNGIMGSLGLGGAGGAGGGSGIMGMASNASSLYSAVSGNGIIGNAASTVGGWLGFGGAAASGLGLSAAAGAGTTLAAAGSGLGLAGSAAGAGYGLTAAGTGLGLSAGSAGAGAIGAGLGTSAAAGSTAAAGAGGISGALAAIPVWGWALAAVGAIAALWDDGSGTLHTGAKAQYSAADGFETTGEGGKKEYGLNVGMVYDKNTADFVGGVAKGLTETFDGLAVAFGQKAGYQVATAFADDTSKDGAWGALRISKDGKDLLNWEDTRTSRWAPKEFADGEAGQKEYLAAIAKDTRKVLLDMDLPSWADTMLESIGDAANMEQLSATLQQIGVIQTTFVQLGKTMEGFEGLTDKAFEALMKASGGFEALSANAGTYYENFYSEAEKTANVTRSVSDALAAVGLAMPATRDDFRALVESQLALGEGGTKAVAALLGVSGAFASVVPSAEAAGQAIGEVLSETMKRLQSDTAGLEIDLLRAQGNTTGANAAQRTLDTTGFTEAEVALYDYNQSLRDQISALNTASEAFAQQADIRAGFERQLLELQGDTTALRLLDIAGMDEYNVSLYDQVAALTATKDAAAQAAENMLTLRSSLIGLESSFAGGGFSRQYRAEDAAGTVSGLLADVGIQKDAGMLAQQMLSATSGEVEAYFREIWDVLETDEARQKLVDVTGVMMDLAQGAGSAAEAFQKQQDNLQALAQDAARLFSARNSAGNLMDRIGGAMGKQGTFGAQRESELWGALGSTRDAEKQVELAGQLTDMVISRQQLEVQNAERMLSFGRSLRSYVDGLKLGNLSPLTNAEKLAEASAQYTEMLGKAQGGDTDAQAGLQGIASTYLDLARTYFAGNEQFSTIFGSVTSALDALGVSSMSEAQQQLNLGTQSLGELQRLYSITETAYGSLNAQYETAVGELAAAQDALVLQSDSLDQLKDIAGLLSGLPTEIAVRLPAINTESATYLPLAMPVQQGAQGDNAALIAELQALRKEVADLRAENRQDAQMVAGATVASASASASQIVDATAKAAYTTTVKQGAVLI